MAAINAGAYLAPGADVAIHEGRENPWQGMVLAIGLMPDSTALVAVVDPLDNPHVIPGEQRVVSWRALRSLRQSRWAR